MSTDLISDDYANMAYLVVLLCGLLGFGLLRMMRNPMETLKSVVAWIVLFSIIVAGAQIMEEREAPTAQYSAEAQTVTVGRSPDGHFYLTLEVNGTPTRFVVDTGATAIVLKKKDAKRAGLPVDTLPYNGIARTANGEVRTARVTLQTLALKEFTDQNVPASVNGGGLDVSLLGMQYLSRFSSIEIKNDTLILTR